MPLSRTEALAWMGADIAKVEPPRGEAGRTGFGDAFYFMMYNATKIAFAPFVWRCLTGSGVAPSAIASAFRGEGLAIAGRDTPA